jgi:hypothetical protein
MASSRLLRGRNQPQNPTPWAAGGRVPLRLWHGLRSTRPPAPEEVHHDEVTPRLTNPYIAKTVPLPGGSDLAAPAGSTAWPVRVEAARAGGTMENIRHHHGHHAKSASGGAVRTRNSPQPLIIPLIWPKVPLGPAGQPPRRGWPAARSRGSRGSAAGGTSVVTSGIC